MTKSILALAQFSVHAICHLLAFPFRLAAFLIFLACILSWVTLGIGMTDLAALIVPILSIVCEPLRPILPWGGIVPLGNGNLYLDLAPIPAGFLISIPARILLWIKDRPMFDYRALRFSSRLET